MNLKNWTAVMLGATGLLVLATSRASFARDFGIGNTTCGSDISIVYSPTTIWPPNHKMRTITIQATDSDNDGDPFSIQVTGITSNQTEANGQGCGSQDPDSAGIGSTAIGSTDPTPILTSVQVRGERCARLGDRVYDIKIACTDTGAAGATADLYVTVPHSIGHPQHN